MCKTDNNTQSEYEESLFRDAVVDFLDCFLKIVSYDSVIDVLPDYCEKFCEKYHDSFSKLDELFLGKVPLDIVIFIEEYYSKFIEDYSNKTILFEFYNRDLEASFVKKINSFCKKEYNTDLSKVLIKLLKIVTIKMTDEQTHYYYYKSIFNGKDKKIKTLSKAIDDAAKHFDRSTSEFNLVSRKVERKMKNAEKKATERSITILGIFSAIVLTFNAGVSFSSIVLENLISSSIYRAVLITIILGLILGNVIIGLFVYLECVRKDDSSKKICNKSVLVLFNIVMIILIAITVLFWHKGFVENRDVEVHKNVVASMDEVGYTTPNNNESTVD